MHRQIRSNRPRETSPVYSLRASARPTNLPGPGDARASLHHPQDNLGDRKPGVAYRVGKHSRGSLHRASFQAQELVESFPDLDRIAPASGFKSLSEKAPPKHFAFEEKTRQKLQEQVPPPTLLRQAVSQLRAEIMTLQKVVRKLADLTLGELPPTLKNEFAETCAKHSDNNNNTNNNNITNNNNNNNDDNNDLNNNKNSRESGLNSLDLDNDNPESELDLDEKSLGSFSPTLGVEFSLRSLGQHEANHSLGNLGHQMMTIGFSLGSLIQQEQDGQEGMNIGTAWEPNLEQTKESFEGTKPKKRVTFSKATLEAYSKRQQNNREQQNKSSQLEQLEHNNERHNNGSLDDELPEENNNRTTTQTCWNGFQQEHQKQQQIAPALAKELQHRTCANNSLDSEGQSLGSLESETQTQQACRSPKHNNNTSSLGIGTKNKAAWGILIDTGAAISLAPLSFAPDIELSPVESTLQLRSVTGEAIEAFGRRTVQLVGSELSFHVSFVIADVQHALIGMDILMANQLSLISNSFNEYYVVNTAGATTQLQPRGHLLYIEACSDEFGLSICRGSSLPEENGSLLDDKGRTQEEAVSSSGGACATSFIPEDLRQQQDKNTAALGTTALPAKGATRRKKKPSAKKASQDQLDQRSLEQKGQKPAAAQLRSLEKTRIIKEIELAAEEQTSLSTMENRN